MHVKEKINELVDEIRKSSAIGTTTSKYSCPIHKRLLQLAGFDVYISIGDTTQFTAIGINSLWRCDECRKIIVTVNEEGLDAITTAEKGGE